MLGASSKGHKKGQGTRGCGSRYLRRSLGGAVEAGASQEHIDFLPGLPPHLLHVEIPLDLRTATGSEEVLKSQKKTRKLPNLSECSFSIHPPEGNVGLYH